MPVLTRDEIERRVTAADDSQIVCTPLMRLEQIGDSSLDFRLGTNFIAFRRMQRPALDIYEAEAQSSPRDFQQKIHVGIGEKFFLAPGMLVLASTLEFLKIPSDIACEVITRSSWGKLGIIIATAAWVHPGFRGCLTLEIVNHAESPVALSPGARIGQLVFYTCDPPQEVPAKEFLKQGFTRPEYSKLFKTSNGKDTFRKHLEGYWHAPS